ncbi:DUF3429 domain-containing protein [Motilimonas pumila]|uniref:DUF3429 domain-containing protein n=1 Tax=Motilimonas pumila TaxID=2303987 RepID=A0A418YF91_9GAMM|nr:DUF3429 domain-containing protein [Motilimonas pumila]RJG47738.1 DUF3429 domain-containing protein [Motilimonas pumila]
MSPFKAKRSQQSHSLLFSQIENQQRFSINWQTLGYAGLVPFFVATFAQVQQTSLFGLSASQVFIAYSAGILSFMAGAVWGRTLNLVDNSKTHFMRIHSNVFALAAFFALLYQQQGIALLILALGYALTLLLEINHFSSQQSPQGYHIMRVRLTFTVIALHCVWLLLI